MTVRSLWFLFFLLRWIWTSLVLPISTKVVQIAKKGALESIRNKKWVEVLREAWRVFLEERESGKRFRYDMMDWWHKRSSQHIRLLILFSLFGFLNIIRAEQTHARQDFSFFPPFPKEIVLIRRRRRNQLFRRIRSWCLSLIRSYYISIVTELI